MCSRYFASVGTRAPESRKEKTMANRTPSAMVFSFLLSRTLVPTLAKYLLHMHVARDDHDGGAPRSRNPLVRFQHAFEERFARLRTGYHGLLALAIEHRG